LGGDLRHIPVSGLAVIKRRLTAVFIVAAAALAAGGLWYHAHFRESKRAAAEKLLLSIEQIKSAELALWRQERVSDLSLLLDNGVFSAYLRRFAASPSDLEAAGVIRSRLRAFLKHKNYKYAALADAECKVLVSAGEKPEPMCPQLESLVPRTLASGRPEMGEFYRSREGGSFHIDVLAQAAQAGRGRRLFLLLRLDPSEYLYPLLQTWPGGSETGETLLVAREGDEIVFLNDLRHVKDAALNLRVPVTAARLPAAMALNGFSGLVRGTDYRGVDVLAAVNPLPGSSWAMVTKMDWDEVMAGTTRVAILLALLGLALLAALGAGTFAMFRGQEEKAGEMLARLTEQVPGVVYQYRLYPDGRSCFPYASPGIAQIYEVTPEQVREDATPVFSRLHPDDLKSTSEAIFASARDLSIFHWEFRVVLPEQGLRWRLCDARPERLPDGGTLWYGIITDVTERKRAEETMRKLNRDLAEKNRELENFLYVTSHDLRSPLVNIQGFSQNLVEHFAALKAYAEKFPGAPDEGGSVKALLEEKVPAALDFITGSAAKMDRLITALLRLSRAGRAAVTPRKVDMNALMLQVTSYFSFRAQQAGAELVCGDLPPCTADREALNQVFSNLVENALKYGQPGRPLRVEISGRRADGRSVYEVRDNGRGMEAAEAGKIWQLFYRVDPAAADGEGVGLALVKALAEKSGGSVEVSSEPGKGSVFRLDFPAAKDEP